MEKENKKTNKEFLDDLNKRYEEYKKRVSAKDKKGEVKVEKPATGSLPDQVPKKDLPIVKTKKITPPHKPEDEPLKPNKEMTVEDQPKEKKKFVLFNTKKKEVPPVAAPEAEKKIVEPKAAEKPVAEQIPKEKKQFFGFRKPKKTEEKTVDKKEIKKVEKSPYAEYYRQHKKQGMKRTPKRHLLEAYLERAGFEDVVPGAIGRKILWGALILAILGASVMLIYAVLTGSTAGKAVGFTVTGGAVFFAIALIIGWLLVYVFLDLRIFGRTQSIEEVLPDFLQLTSANISAGMPIDKALWMAIRPQFGVLSKEIQEVAKATMAGESLEKALHTFTEKYNSPTLTRAVNLLLEGLSAGGEMADLLNKIAIDIQELRLMRKEMAADVMTYVLFITVASVLVAPFLFGLATQLLIIVQSIVSNLNIGAGGVGSTGMGSMFSFNFTEETIKIRDFRIFCLSMLTVSSFFSACIISMIRKGNIKEGIKYIPLFILVTLTLYALASWGIGKLFSGFF